MLTRKQKEELIENLTDKFSRAKSSIFADYKGLKVSDLKDLRRKLKGEQIELKIAKKTLIDLALKKANVLEAGTKKMIGQIAIAFGFGDEVSAAKNLAAFARKNGNLKILGGILEGKFLDEAQSKALAKVSSREQSLAQLIGVINAPVANFVSVLQGNLRGLVFVLSQIDAKRHPEGV